MKLFESRNVFKQSWYSYPDSGTWKSESTQGIIKLELESHSDVIRASVFKPVIELVSVSWLLFCLLTKPRNCMVKFAEDFGWLPWWFDVRLDVWFGTTCAGSTSAISADSLFHEVKIQKRRCKIKRLSMKKNSRQSVDLAGSLRLTHIQNLNRTSVRYHQCKLAHWFRNDNNPSHKRLEIWIQNFKAFRVQKQLILPEILLIIQYMQTW